MPLRYFIIISSHPPYFVSFVMIFAVIFCSRSAIFRLDHLCNYCREIPAHFLPEEMNDSPLPRLPLHTLLQALVPRSRKRSGQASSPCRAQAGLGRRLALGGPCVRRWSGGSQLSCSAGEALAEALAQRRVTRESCRRQVGLAPNGL